MPDHYGPQSSPLRGIRWLSLSRLTNTSLAGAILIRICSALSLLALSVLVSVSDAGDYLGGGYYLSPDPALNMMLDSMDRQTTTLGSGVARPVARETVSKASSKTASATADFSGRWHFELSEGKSIDLALHQSGARIFGSGSLFSGKTAQEATASGSAVGNSMMLDVVTLKGTALYATSLDLSRSNLASSYNLFRAGAQSKSGTLRASRLA